MRVCLIALVFSVIAVSSEQIKIVENSAAVSRHEKIVNEATIDLKNTEEFNSINFEYNGSPRVPRGVNNYAAPSNQYVSNTFVHGMGATRRGLPNPCYINQSGFVCCNKDLENVMSSTYYDISNNPGFNNCNTQRIATVIQKACEAKFGKQFESIVGLSDYSQKVHFHDRYICKIEVNGRYILAYGTPLWKNFA